MNLLKKAYYISGATETMTPEKLESNMEEAAKQGIKNLVDILSTSLTIQGKKSRMKSITDSLILATSEEE